MKVILASGSPRRFALLRQLGWEPEVHALPFEEVKTCEEAEQALVKPQAEGILAEAGEKQDPPFSPGERRVLLAAFQGSELVCAYNALGKAGAAAAVKGDVPPVIGADTIVVLKDRILGKPRDRQEAVQMLTTLSGRLHKVKTAAAVFYNGRRMVEAVTTEVKFRRLTDREIERYVATGEPLDKAGAYGIQGKGSLLAEGIRGSYDNVVGLPLTTVYLMLQKLGAPVL